MPKCASDCTCGRHRPYIRTAETRHQAAEQMRARWDELRQQPEALAAYREALSLGHQLRWNPERRAEMAATVERLSTPEATAKKNTARHGKWHGKPARGEFVSDAGYHGKTSQYDHPLSTKAGVLMEHRSALYDAIGPGPHECHWNSLYGCGKTSLPWGGVDGIHVDHLDNDKANNDPANLVPSCCGCNLRRGREAKMVRDLHAAGVIADVSRYWQVRTQK